MWDAVRCLVGVRVGSWYHSDRLINPAVLVPDSGSAAAG